MEDIYLDRWGKAHTPKKDSVVRTRKGAFFVPMACGALLLTYAHFAPNSGSLPGGGIDRDEMSIQAARREFLEETEMVLPFDAGVAGIHRQTVLFYADDVDEFWRYEQTFFLVNKGLEYLYFDAQKSVSEGVCAWMPVEALKSADINFWHRNALEALGVFGRLDTRLAA